MTAEAADYDFEAAGAAMDEAAAAVANDDAVRLASAYELPSPVSRDAGYPQENRAAVEAIQQAILKDGALDLGMAEPFEDDAYWGPGDGAYHWFYDASANGISAKHAVTLVGWDDSCSRMNFAIPYTGQEFDGDLAMIVNADGTPAYESDGGGDLFIVPRSDGAWLVRNSRGADFGEGGYLWVPYYDGSLRAPAAFTADSTPAAERPDKNYQYDGLAAKEVTSWEAGLQAANVFTASGSEELASVGMWTTRENATVSIQVYTGLTDAADPTSGKLAVSFEVSELYAGYHTFDLPEPVGLSTGESFSVVVSEHSSTTAATPGFAVPVEAATVVGWNEDGTPRYDASPVVEEGQSFICQYGRWYDVASTRDAWEENVGAPVGNVAVKAFTRTSTAPGPDPGPDPDPDPSPEPNPNPGPGPDSGVDPAPNPGFDSNPDQGAGPAGDQPGGNLGNGGASGGSAAKSSALAAKNGASALGTPSTSDVKTVSLVRTGDDLREGAALTLALGAFAACIGCWWVRRRTLP